MNDFEKYIKSQEKEFRLTPSPEVWEGVRRRLDRKRRRGFIIILFSGLFITASGLLYIQQRNHSAVISKPATTQSVTAGEETVKENPIATLAPFEREKAGIQPEGKREIDLKVNGQASDKGHQETTMEMRENEIPVTASPILLPDELQFQVEESAMAPVEIPADSTAAAIPVADTSTTEKDSMLQADSVMQRFTVGALFFAGHALHELKENTSLAAIAAFRNRNSEAGLTYIPSVFIRYALSSKISLTAGAGMQVIREKVDNSQPVYSTDTVFSPVSGIFTNYEVHTVVKNGLLDSSISHDGKVSNEFIYMHVPLSFSYSFYEKGRSSFQLMLTASWMNLISADYYRYDLSGRYVKSGREGLRKSNIAAGGGIAYGYKFGKRTSLVVAPSCHWLMDYITDDDSVLEQDVNYFGISAGLQIKLK